MNRKMFPASMLVAALALGSLSGCSSFDLSSFASTAASGATTVRSGAVNASGPVTAADKIKVLPLGEEDLDCPSVDIAEGGATSRVGGPDNNTVRYQFDIGDVARECTPQGSQFALKLGISGQALVGPAGSPGTFSTDLKIVIEDGATKKQLYQKSYKVTVNTNGGARGAFSLVADPIMLPLTRTDLDNIYKITIGLGNSVVTSKRKRT